MHFWSTVREEDLHLNGGKPAGIKTEQGDDFYKLSFEYNGDNYVLNVQNEIAYSLAVTSYL